MQRSTLKTLEPAISDNEKMARGVEAFASITAEEREALLGLPITVKALAAEQPLVSEGDQPTYSAVVLSGLLCSYKILTNGSRQIMAFWVAGDIPDLHSLHLNTMDHSIGAVQPSKVGVIPHSALHEVTRRYPGLAEALWRKTLIDASIYREWLTGIGRRPAYSRIAHLFCELFVKFRAVGLAEQRGFRLPLTQQDLGDALGLSTVHVNRVLQQLRREGLIGAHGRTVVILDWDGLRAAGGFDPAYLHLGHGDAQDLGWTSGSST